MPINIIYNFSYNNLIDSKFFVCFCPISWILDSIINSNTGFFAKGDFVKDRKIIFAHYLRNCLLEDLISVLPIIIYIFSNSYHLD